MGCDITDIIKVERADNRTTIENVRTFRRADQRNLRQAIWTVAVAP